MPDVSAQLQAPIHHRGCRCQAHPVMPQPCADDGKPQTLKVCAIGSAIVMHSAQSTTQPGPASQAIQPLSSLPWAMHGRSALSHKISEEPAGLTMAPTR